MTKENYPSWDAKVWLNEFEASKSIQGGTRPVRAKVFQSTLEIVKCGGYETPSGVIVRFDNLHNGKTLQDNVFCEKEISLRNVERKYDTEFKVVNQDCLAYAKTLLDKDYTDDLCVLNMASAKNPGGGVYGGAGAQEEYLFRCSDYFRFLFQYADPASFDCEKVYGIPHNMHHSYPLKDNFGGVYSHGVTVFRDTEANGYALLETPWQVNFVAVAANNIRRFMDGRTTIPDQFIPSTLNLIRTILRLAYNNGQRRLVLGAFGCGAFANPPKHMAELFKQVFNEKEFQGLFREIHFAIIEDHNSHGRNYNAFKEVLCPECSSDNDKYELDDSKNDYKHEIESLLLSTGRKGVENVLKNLNDGGFYTVPASIKFHNNFEGGLAHHSLRVYQEAYVDYQNMITSGKALSFGVESVIICSLLHDVCKMDEYCMKHGSPHHTKQYYSNRDGLHGTKTVDILTQWGLVLSEEEKAAIRWHMGIHTKDAFEIYNYDYQTASSQSVLVKLIHDADSKSAKLDKE